MDARDQVPLLPGQLVSLKGPDQAGSRQASSCSIPRCGERDVRNVLDPLQASSLHHSLHLVQSLLGGHPSVDAGEREVQKIIRLGLFDLIQPSGPCHPGDLVGLAGSSSPPSWRPGPFLQGGWHLHLENSSQVSLMMPGTFQDPGELLPFLLDGSQDQDACFPVVLNLEDVNRRPGHQGFCLSRFRLLGKVNLQGLRGRGWRERRVPADGSSEWWRGVPADG